MSKLYISDTHFNHGKIITDMGRSQFSSIEEHDETIVDNINRVVSPNDILYHAGDLVMNTTPDNIDEILKRTIGRIKCKIYLALGNHDTPSKLISYMNSGYFERIAAHYEGHAFGKKYMICHIPLPECEMERFSFNIHGHRHEETLPDKRFFNISCENIDYTPIAHEIIMQQFKELL